MRTTRAFWLLFLAFTGCDTLGRTKVDNPVAGPPPPRVKLASTQSVGTAHIGTPLSQPEQAAEAEGVVRLASAESSEVGDEVFALQPVAVVNGSPILAGDILERYGASLEEARQKTSAEQFREVRLDLIERDLPGHIDRKLLADALRSTLKSEQIKALNEAIGKAFDEEIAGMMKEMGVNTRHELELELQKQKTSLASLRDNFATQQMAMEYIRSKAGKLDEIGRPELLQYYQAHAEDYAVPAKVKWQQILIAFRGDDEKRQALNELEQAIQELKSGADFGDVARRLSGGYNAESGGHFGWTEAGSLSNREIEKALFELPVGSISRVFEDSTSFQLVKVTDRQPAGRVPFATVQDTIREQLEKETRRQLAERVVQELRAGAVIVTMFDENKSEKKRVDRS